MKILFGPTVASASGKMGGIVYSRNRYGAYTRLLGPPVNPNTARQSTNRANFAYLGSFWLLNMSEAQRLAWETYAANVPIVPQSGGSPVNLTGNSMFIRCNLPRLTAGLTVIADGPVQYSLCQLSDPTVSVEADSPGDCEVTFNDGDEWAVATGGALLVFTSPQMSPARNFYKGGYQFAFAILGAGTPPTSPHLGSATKDWAAGNRAFVRFLAVSPDGRISNTIQIGGIIT